MCPDCGVNKVGDSIKRENTSALQKPDIVVIKQWETERQPIPETAQFKIVMKPNFYRKTAQGLLEMFLKSLATFAEHMFYNQWNFHQYVQCKNNLEKGEIAMVLDFAQNYLCIQQNEVQQLHWGHVKVMIHPISFTYRCPLEGCNELVKHDIVHISNDKTHDSHLVRKMMKATWPILRRQNVSIRKIIEWTDQAPQQYKNKCAFHYICENNVPTMRNFFGVRHGKGPSDAVTG